MNEPRDLIFDDGVMRAELVHGSWLFIVWLNNTIGHLSKKLIQDLRMMEDLIRRNRWKGWVTNSEKDHENMHRIIKKVGGIQCAEDKDLIYFKKEFSYV